jgi:hypothetical protein
MLLVDWPNETPVRAAQVVTAQPVAPIRREAEPPSRFSPDARRRRREVFAEVHGDQGFTRLGEFYRSLGLTREAEFVAARAAELR